MLATALGLKAVDAAYRVYYTTAADLVARATRAAIEGRWQTTMRFWNGSAVLVIDELGYLPMPGEAASHLFQVISRRYQHGSVILTTNRGIAQWGETFEDTTVAILDRLLHHATVLIDRRGQLPHARPPRPPQAATQRRRSRPGEPAMSASAATAQAPGLPPASTDHRSVPGQARQLAPRLSALFDLDVEIVKRLNDAHHRLANANQQLDARAAPDMRRLPDLHGQIHRAFRAYQDAAEQRRQLAV